MTAKHRPTDHTPQLGKVRHANLSPAELYEHAIRLREGVIVDGGPLVVRTGKHTGRSPQDKFIVDEPAIHDKVWWGGFNNPISIEKYEALRARIFKHLESKELFVQEGFVGADPAYRRSLRAYTETAWASVFCDNLFIRPRDGDLDGFEPNFTIIDAPSFKADPARDGTRSETVILVNLTRQEIIIAGTEYAGEIKKGAFGIMNFRLPDEGVLPMHSSVNVGADGTVAIFFGLSGTGKTTLSADPERTLIGDDEHGWGPEGVFNFEGGCYAKTIRLSHIYEPDIYSTTRHFGTILENVVFDEADPRAGPGLRGDHGEHPRGVPAPLHQQLVRHRHGRAPAQRDLPHGGRVRRAAAHQPAVARPGDVPLHQRLHRQARGHGGGRQGARRHVLALLRRPVHAPPPRRLRGDAGREAGPVRRAGLDGQHRLDRRPVRHRRADEHQAHPQHGPRRAQRRARRRRDRHRPDLRRPGAGARAGCPG